VKDQLFCLLKYLSYRFERSIDRGINNSTEEMILIKVLELNAHL